MSEPKLELVAWRVFTFLTGSHFGDCVRFFFFPFTGVVCFPSLSSSATSTFWSVLERRERKGLGMKGKGKDKEGSQMRHWKSAEKGSGEGNGREEGNRSYKTGEKGKERREGKRK